MFAKLCSTAAAGVVVAAIGFCALPTASADDAKQFLVVERATSDTITDLGAKGDSVGDILTFANDIYDQSNDNKDSVLAVTGGTGEFTKARGEMGLHARDSKGSAYDFSYSLRE